LNPAWIIALPEDVAVSPEGERGLILCGAGQLTLRGLTPALRGALARLAHPGEVAGRLSESVRQAEGVGALARWSFHLQRLARTAWLRVSARARQAPLATLIPISATFDLATRALGAGGPWVLSRFAYLRRRDDTMVLESPASGSRLILHDARALALVNALARPRGVEELAGAVPDLPGEAALDLLDLLIQGEMVREVGPTGSTVDEEAALQGWEFHDLLFHARSREGRYDGPLGATYPLAGRVDPPAALKASAGEGIDLDRPAAEQQERGLPPLGWVMERRRSIREYSAEPISVGQLGEFLYRVGRIKDSRRAEVDTGERRVLLEYTERPYPSGGGLYGLEFYVAVNACRDLGAGLYHYDAGRHRLGRLAERTAEVEQLLEDAGLAAGLEREGLQVLLILAARFARVAWKYSAVAYSLILKEVGVLYQTMYLTATALGLAPCALGTGNADLFARAARTDYYAESSVGEFLLGSRPLE
jgi:SagB-type dehydrogenase family enzyme